MQLCKRSGDRGTRDHDCNVAVRCSIPHSTFIRTQLRNLQQVEPMHWKRNTELSRGSRGQACRLEAMLSDDQDEVERLRNLKRIYYAHTSLCRNAGHITGTTWPHVETEFGRAPLQPHDHQGYYRGCLSACTKSSFT
eukprot:738024-Pelagomonas_calceolata.AAC.3